MQIYASPKAQAVALRRAVARTQCLVRSVRVDGPQVCSSLVCVDGWDAGRLLLALAIEDARTPGVVAIAHLLRQDAPEDEDFAQAIHDYARANVRFQRQSVQLFQSVGFTLLKGEGDCTAQFRLVYAIATAGGLPAALGLLSHGKAAPPAERGPTHAVALLRVGDRWLWCETTIAAELGENPNDAARRLGLTDERDDIAKEVTIMTEADLAPLPANFREHNDPAQVTLDAEALQRLGYLDSDVAACALSDPTATVLRLAVLEFQHASGIVADGLLGPTTRLMLARALTQAGPPITEGFHYPGMMIGELGAAPSLATAKTAHLSPAFFALVRAMAERFREKGARITARDLLLVWLSESGIKNIPNGQGAPFGGLNQMGPTERRAAGFPGTFGEWLAMSLEDQLPFVERYYLNATAGDFSHYADANSLYLANAAPAHMPHAAEPDHVVFRRDPAGPMPGAPESEWAPWRAAHKGDPYAWNLGLDVNKDGTIRVGELGAVLRAAEARGGAYWIEVQARLGADEPAAIDPEPSIAGGVAGVVLLGVGAAGALAWWAFA